MTQTQELVFRVAELCDAALILSLVQRAYRGEPSRSGWTTEADLLGGQRTDLEQLKELFRDPDCIVLAATLSKTIVGTVTVQKQLGAAYIGQFAVDPSVQARGIGRLLLAEAERIAIERFEVEVARMTVIVQRQELIRWYERRGYRATGEREPFPYHDPRFGLPKRPDLEFVVLSKALSRPGDAKRQ